MPARAPAHPVPAALAHSFADYGEPSDRLQDPRRVLDQVAHNDLVVTHLAQFSERGGDARRVADGQRFARKAPVTA